MRHPRWIGFALLLSLGGACASRAAEPRSPVPPEHAPPWPATFLQPALLVADEIAVEGPRGLLVHLALRHESDVVDLRSETRPEGFWQEATVRPEADRIQVRAQLDAWNLVALRRMTVLERPGAVPVIVRAVGDVAFTPLAGAGAGAETQRSALFERRSEP
jgi:hypothetical protein